MIRYYNCLVDFFMHQASDKNLKISVEIKESNYRKWLKTNNHNVEFIANESFGCRLCKSTYVLRSVKQY